MKQKKIPLRMCVISREKLPKKDHELFMLLVNYKNNREFKNSLKDGE